MGLASAVIMGTPAGRGVEIVFPVVSGRVWELLADWLGHSPWGTEPCAVRIMANEKGGTSFQIMYRYG